MPIKLNSSGGGSVTIDVPSTASSYTLTAPAVTANLLTSSTQSIPKAALPTGSVLQVVQATYQGQTIITTGTFTSTGLTGTITPQYSTSKIYVVANAAAKVQSGTTNLITFFRNGSNIVANHLLQHSAAGDYIPIHMQYLDSPASTSAQTYTVYFRSNANNGSYASGFGGDNYGAFPLMTIVMMEIAA